jgi:hypothetical protein
VIFTPVEVILSFIMGYNPTRKLSVIEITPNSISRRLTCFEVSLKNVTYPLISISKDIKI